MKKVFLSLLAMAVISLSASAQDSSSYKKQHNKSMKAAHRGGKADKKEMMKDLDLSVDQKKEMKENREEFKIKIAAIDQDKSLSETQKNEKKASLRKEQKSNMQSVLTPEQKTKMAENKKEARKDSKERSEKRMSEMKTELSLTDEQVMQLTALNVANHAKMKTIREDDSLDEAAKKQKMADLRNSADQRRQTILTPEQMKKMKEMKGSKKHHKGKKPRTTTS